MSHTKFGPDRFSRFDVYWIQIDRQTNKQTDKQAKFIYGYRMKFNPKVQQKEKKTIQIEMRKLIYTNFQI